MQWTAARMHKQHRLGGDTSDPTLARPTSHTPLRNGRPGAQQEVSEVGIPSTVISPRRRLGMVAVSSEARVGPLLREWRKRRRMTQLELSLDAGISARHLSFIE